MAEKEVVGLDEFIQESSSLLQLTPPAIERLRGFSEKEELSGQYLRVFVSGGGCAGLQYGMAFDESPGEEDHQLTIEGTNILIDQISYPYLAGATIDYVEDLMSGGFQIHNPNAQAACGCGTSFRPKEDPNQLSSRKRRQKSCGC
jgi:iron-sulfur cluster assembly protein